MAGSSNDWSYTSTDFQGGELEFNTETLEELFKRLNKAANDGHAVTEKERKALHKAYRDYLEWFNSQPLSTTPPQPLPPPKKAVPPKPPTQSKPTVQDTKQDQAAPDIQEPTTSETTVAVDRHPPQTQVSPQKAADVHFGKSAKEAEQVASMVTPPPTTDAQRQSLILNIQRNESPGESHPTHAEPASHSPASSADPVDLFSGAFTITVVDLAVPTATADIRLERSYRSGRPYYGPFGYSWDHNHNVHLRPLNNGAIAMWNGRLREQTFVPDAGQWKPAYGSPLRIERAVGFSDIFDVTFPGGTRWHFERPLGWTNAERIPLAKVMDRHGNTVQYSYDATNRLSSVLDGAGRGLVFSYGLCGLLESVRDHTGSRVVRYDHHAEIEHLETVTLPATAQYPDGVKTRYVYDYQADHPAMRHNIVRVVDAQGRTYIQNEYAGPQAGWSFNSVTRQLLGEFEYQFEYEQIQFVPYNEIYLDILAARTTVGHPDGSLHIYTFNYRGDLLDHRYRLNRDHSYRVFATQYLYDAAGNVKETIGPDGIRYVLTYDATNVNFCARRDLLRIDLAAPVTGGPSRTLLRAQYDSKYQLPRKIVDERGQETEFKYDFDSGSPSASGRLERITLPTATLPDGTLQQNAIQVESNPQGQITAVIDAEGVRTEYEYIVGGVHNGLATKVVEDAQGLKRTTECVYDATGFVNELILPGGHSAGMSYNKIGQLEEYTPPAIDAISMPIRRWFNDNGSVVRVERPRGKYKDAVIGEPFLLDLIERNVLDHVVIEKRASNTIEPQVVKRHNDHRGVPTKITDPTGLVTEYRYDERGAPVRETVGIGLPNSLISEFSYDVSGRIVRMVDPAKRTTVIKRDLWGRPKEIRLPSGATKFLVWGDGDLLLESWVEGSPGLGQPQRRLEWESFEYDERKRRRSETRWSFVDDHNAADPLTTRYFHDGCDRIREIREPRGGIIRIDHDALGRPIRVEDEHGNTRKFMYDAAGNLDQETISEIESGLLRQHVLTHSYDARGHRRVSEGRGSRIEYEYDDRDCLVETRENGSVLSGFEFNAFGEITERVVDTTGLVIRSSCSYDKVGRITQFVDPLGMETVWSRDAFGLPKTMKLSDGSEWNYSFDFKTRTSKRVAPSAAVIEQQFDAAHDQVQRFSCIPVGSLAAVPAHEFEYDGLGRLVKAKTTSSEVERQYDSLGRLVLETAGGKSVRFEYDDPNGFIELVFPDGRRERTALDKSGRPVSVELVTAGSLGGAVGEKLAEVTYGGARQPRQVIHSNGVLTAIVYDDPGRIIRIEHTEGGNSLDSYRTRLDTRGRRAVVQFTGVPARTVLYEYDKADRLQGSSWGFPFSVLPDIQAATDHATAISTAASASSGSTNKELYELDNADGRKKRVRVGALAGTDSYVLGPDHRIVQSNLQPISYHVDGHRLADGRFSYDLDALGRVTRVNNSTNGSVEAEFNYDPLSRISSGTIGGVTFSRWFGGLNWVHEERGATADVRQASPHPLWPHPLCVRTASSSHFLHPDGGLSTTCVTNDAGQVVERHRYGPFGAPEVFANDGLTPIAASATVIEPMWRAMPLLGTTGLYITAHRLYDPQFGEFTARDPLLYKDSPCPYVYAGRNPVDFADPRGLSKSPVQQAGYMIPPLPAVSGETFRPGFAWVHYTGALNDAMNPETPTWARVVLGTLAVAAAPLALVERTITETGNLGVGVGEHIGRGYMLSERGEGLEAAADYLEAIANFAVAFLNLASFAEGAVSSGPPLPKRVGPLPKLPPIEPPPPAAPAIELHYSPILASAPQDANWLRFNIEWVMQEVGYFIRSERLAEDSALRAAARKYMDKQGFDRTGLQAMHPLDDIAAGYFRRPGQVGTTYYFGDAGVNMEFGREFGNQLNRLGVKVGDRFRVIFTGNWPSYLEFPPIAPPASPPGLR